MTSMPTGFFIWRYMYPFTFIFGGTSKFLGVQSLTLHLGVQRKLTAFSPCKVVHHAVFVNITQSWQKLFFSVWHWVRQEVGFCLTRGLCVESGSFRPDDLFAPGRFAPLTCSPRVVSPRKVSRFAPLNCYYIIIDEVCFDNFLIIIYLLASCCGFSYYYRFSDIAISSVNPSFIWRLEFSKNG